MCDVQKIVVFDLDETLGYFVELGIFWDSLHVFLRKDMNIDKQGIFNTLLDLFPECIRPNMTTILEYLKLKKMNHTCNAVMIYTNNQGPKEWTHYITNYFNEKLNYPLFTRVICAFKVNGKRIEFCRRSHDKNMSDFIRCANIPKHAKICYLDDTYYPNMNNHNVYYIKIKPYTHDLSFDEMIQRFLHSHVASSWLHEDIDKEHFVETMKQHMHGYHFIFTDKDKQEYELDKIITKKIMSHIETFFHKQPELSRSCKKTMKHRIGSYKPNTKTLRKF